MKLLSPKTADPAALATTMHEQGYAMLSAASVCELSACSMDELMQLRPTWDELSPDNHQFRIDTEGGVGRPTPEGAHRDGVDFVAVFLVAREAIKGGETRVFEADGPHGERFTLTEPWSLMLLDDERVIHESTPIQPAGERGGHRDTLVLTYRRGAFLDG